jgi:hypothetical protein
MAEIRTRRNIVGPDIPNCRSSNADSYVAPVRLRARRTGCRGG